MKYKFSRKINLSNIDKQLYPYETEDIGIEDADSFEEATKEVDKFVAERIGYYKAISNMKKVEPAPAPAPMTPPPSTLPIMPATAPMPAPAPPITTGGTTQPPQEFQI